MFFLFDIPEYPDYKMNKMGEIFSLKTNKVLKPIKHSTGYNVIRLTNSSGVKTIRYHRIVAKVLVPNPENLPVVNHIDGDKRNNRPDNLEWCTHKHNHDHAIDKGLKSNGVGVKNPACRFDKEEVKSWLSDLISGKKNIQDIAKEVGAARTTISRLINIEFPGMLPKYNGNWKTRNN